MDKQNYTLSIEQIQKEIGNFSKASAKRKEHAHIIAMACMLQGAEHRNLTPLTEFAKVLTEAELSCLRIWAERFSPARKRAVKGGGFVFKFAKPEDGQEEQVFNMEEMVKTNFLDIDLEKAIKEQIFGTDKYLERVEKFVKDIDKALKGEKEGVTVQEDERDQVQNLRNHLAKLLTIDLDEDTEEVTIADEAEEKQAA